MNHVILLKRLMLLFWAVWFSVVFLSNLADALKTLHVLPISWAFASGNFKFIAKKTALYATPTWMNGVLFAGAILWEGIAAALFWRAGWKFNGRKSAGNAVYLAFTTALLLWGTFLLADEICIAYDLAGTHLRLFVAHLVTLLAIELLPE